jgi:fibro-slime domain-containing protein
MKKAIFLASALLLFFATGTKAQTVYAATIKVPVTFYDFHANGSNPDFEPAPRIGTGGILSLNEVGDTLDLEKKPMLGTSPYFSQRVTKWFRPWQPGDFTVPLYSNVGVYLHDSTIATDTSYKNIVILDTLIFNLVPGSAGVYQFSSTAFFTLDGRGFGNEPAGQNHNFSFTMELHVEFTYQTGLSFDLSGDDDIWAFVNRRRVIDLGGIHGSFSASVNFDTLAGVTVGQKYMLDLFYTERHITGSDILINSNIFAGAPVGLVYKHNPTNCVVGSVIIPDTAVVTGAVDSFTVSPALPAGLSLDKATGIISGTPTTATPTINYSVTATNAAGSVTARLSITISVPTGAPATPSIVYPAAGAVGVPVTVSFRWHPVAGASTYRLQVSTTPDFNGIVKDSFGLTDTAFTLTNLSNNASYYWCVNATNVAGTSSWSATATFTTVAGAPGPVVLVSPMDTAKIQADLVLLVWNKASPAVTKYLVQIATDSGMSHILLADSTVTDTSTILMSLATSTTYWWEVKAYNSAGWGTFSTKSRFTIVPSSTIPKQFELRSLSLHASRNILRYALPKSCFVSVKYYDVKGRTVSTFVDKMQAPGYYSLSIQVSAWPTGTYIQIFSAGSIEKRQRVTIVR